MQNPSTLSPHGTLASPQKAWWYLLLTPHLFIFLFIFPVHSTATVNTINSFREVILFPCLTFLHTFNFIYFSLSLAPCWSFAFWAWCHGRRGLLLCVVVSFQCRFRPFPLPFFLPVVFCGVLFVFFLLCYR